MRLGWFGGSFDPPHLGHAAVAQAAARHLSLDRILLAPTGLQPLKRQGAQAAFTDRLEMVRLLCQADPSLLEASSLDGPRPDGSPNYTADTLAHLHHLLPSADLFALLGADNLLDLPRWHQADQLLHLASWIAISRPDYPLPASLPPLLATAQATGRLHLVQGVAVDISSSTLRARLAAGQDCTALLPPAVLAYIHEHSLYQHPAFP